MHTSTKAPDAVAIALTEFLTSTAQVGDPHA
jgi:hypothetical protein